MEYNRHSFLKDIQNTWEIIVEEVNTPTFKPLRVIGFLRDRKYFTEPSSPIVIDTFCKVLFPQ